MMHKGCAVNCQPGNTVETDGKLSLGVYLGLSVLSQILFALAFPKPGWWPLIFVALIPMGWLALGAPCARRLAWTTYAVSYVAWLVLMRWMIPVTFGGWWAMCLYLAMHVPVALLIFRLLVKYWRFPATLALPMAWVSLEWLRGHFPSGGFGWYVLGHALAPWQTADSPPMIAQLASIFGELGISFFVAMHSGWVLDGMRLRGLAGGWQRPGWRNMITVTLIMLLGWAGALVYGLGQTTRFLSQSYTWPQTAVAVVQTNLPQYNKESPTAQRLQQEWTSLLDLTRLVVQQAKNSQPMEPTESPARAGAGVVLWTETIVPRPLDDQSLRYVEGQADGLPGSAYYHEQIAALSRELQVHLVVGTPWWHWESFLGADGANYVRPAGAFNAAVLYRPDGQRDPMHYAKMHRVPFGEYVPWVEDWPWLKRQFIRYLTPYEFDYTLQPGKLPVVFEVHSLSLQENGGGAALRLVTPICFEDAVPRVCRRLVYDAQGHKRADLIANLTNDGWFAGTHQPWQHLQIATLRSIELGVPTARAVNTGISGFISSVGRIEKLVMVEGQAQDVAGVAVHPLSLDPMATFYGRWGDLPVRLVVIFTVLMSVAGVIRHGCLGRQKSPKQGG